MRKLRLAAGAVVLLGAVALLVAYRRSDASAAPAYRYATVDRADLESKVTSTGTLSADTTVQVGTQVSGRITNIYVDFNDHVHKGQLVARVDSTLAQQAVADAQAGVARAQATLDQTKGDYAREKEMYDHKVVTLTEFAQARSAYEVAKANVTSAEVALEKAKQDLGYTNIYAPIDGIVVERNVSVGQTVAASFSAPQLFLLANDLSNMQILASVDESDIGLIKTGQPVRFTVQAYPNRTFMGMVKQVRLQSATQDNVVNYTVVVSVRNPDGALLPGMTATVDFLTGSAHNVLAVPNAALRFRPTPEMLAQLRNGKDSAGRALAESVGKARGASTGAAGRRGQGGGGPEGARRGGGGGGGGAGGGGAFGGRGGFGGAGGGGFAGGFAGRRDPNMGVVWYVDHGTVKIARVRTGLTDGQRTQIDSPEIKPGMQVIVGLALGDVPQSGPNSPFQQGRGPGGPPFGRF